MATETRGLKALENWAKRVTSGYNGVKVTDMTTSFRNGLAFCAIIHHYFPDLIDFESLSKENALYNNTLAFSTAEKQLGVPALLDAEDMVQCLQIDRLSIYTYLSQLHNCFENQNKVNKIRSTIKRIADGEQSSMPSKVPLMDQKNHLARTHEVCQVCKHRVFILERLMVCGKLYHRTCFKCCKCQSILNPGAYVESDEPGTYECTICPKDEPTHDESKQPNVETESEKKVSNLSGTTVDKTSLTSSPLVSADVTPLSSPFNAARNFFLQKSMENESHHEDHSIENSSIDSFSATVDQVLENAEFSESDVSDKETSAVTENSVDVQNKSTESKPFRPLPDTMMKRPDLSSETKLSSYQSPFTREALHLTSLKNSLAHRRRLGEGSKSYFDIPTLKLSNTQMSTHLPRPLSTDNFSSKTVLFSTSIYGERSGKDLYDAGSKPKSARRRLSLETTSTSQTDSHKQDHEDFDKRIGDADLASNKTSEQLAGLKEASESSSPKSIEKTELDLTSLSEVRVHETEIPKTESGTLVHDKPDSIQLSQTLLNACESQVTSSNLQTSANDSKVPEHLVVEFPKSVPEDSVKSNDTLTKSSKDQPLVKNSVVPENEKHLKVEPPSLKAKEVQPEEILYPDDLNPFGDDEEDDSSKAGTSYPDTLNPFGDSDEDDEHVEYRTPTANRTTEYDESKNPFASDEEEEDDTSSQQSLKRPARPPLPAIRTTLISQTPQPRMSTSNADSGSLTGSLKGTTSKKRAAPTPPSVKDIFPDNLSRASSGNSLTSPSSDPHSLTMPSPKARKSKRAPLPPSVPRNVQNINGDIMNGKEKKDLENMKRKSVGITQSPQQPVELKQETVEVPNTMWKKKRPAPPVPVPPRREIKKIPLKEIQSEMGEIEEKLNDLEKHGKELEVQIRDKDKDIEPTVEEEEYIMQLFELVNQKNALFRRQAELMYIKRSQRLEEEQVELEFQIRCLATKPANQRTEQDTVKEDELLKRLLDVVDQRNEIVDSIELDRKRETEEDASVHEQMEIKNSDLPITDEIKEKSAGKKKHKKHKEKKEKKKSKDKVKPETPDSHGKRGTLSSKKWF